MLAFIREYSTYRSNLLNQGYGELDESVVDAGLNQLNRLIRSRKLTLTSAEIRSMTAAAETKIRKDPVQKVFDRLYRQAQQYALREIVLDALKASVVGGNVDVLDSAATAEFYNREVGLQVEEDRFGFYRILRGQIASAGDYPVALPHALLQHKSNQAIFGALYFGISDDPRPYAYTLKDLKRSNEVFGRTQGFKLINAMFFAPHLPTAQVEYLQSNDLNVFPTVVQSDTLVDYADQIVGIHQRLVQVR